MIDYGTMSLPTCPICGKVFASYKAKENHMSLHYNSLAKRGLQPKMVYDPKKSLKFVGYKVLDD